MDERRAIEGTLRDLEVSLAQLEAQAADLKEQIADKRELISFWRAKAEAAAHGGGIKRRLKKGEPLRIARGVLAGHPDGLTIAQVAEAGNIQWSTARTTLTKNSDIFHERGGVWFLAEPKDSEGGLAAVK